MSAPHRRCITRLGALACAVAAPFAVQAAPDLIVDAIDTAAVTGDWQALTINGPIWADIANVGDTSAAGPFEVLFFEDLDLDGAYTDGVDAVLGMATAPTIPSGGVESVGITVVDTSVLFRDNLIFVVADSEDVVSESNEANNSRNTGLDCLFTPPSGAIDPVLEWSWNGSSVEPNALNVMMTPSVIDVSGDGIPDVVFAATPSTGGGAVEIGFLRALDGATGAELYTITAADLRINTASSIAVGDIDLDGQPEIIACSYTNNRLVAFEQDGTFKWFSSTIEGVNWGAPAIADLDGDGSPEIIMGRQALNANGSLLWTGTGGVGGIGQYPLSYVADIDLDGSPDVVAGNTVYNADGTTKWFAAGVPDGHGACANFDADDFPELVHVSGGLVRLFEHDGTIKWGPVSIPGGGQGGPPTIADYDNDGEVEIGVAGASRYVVFETSGAVKWTTVTQDSSSNRTGSSVFDFDGDGSAEVVYRDELFLRVYRGTDGATLFQTPMSSCTWHEYVLVADVDADGNAEIVAVANNNCGFGPQRGVYVFGSASDSWVPTRPLWSEFSYHITNINDDGSIPAVEENNWLFPVGDPYNNYRQNVLSTGVPPTAAPDLTASFLQFIEIDGVKSVYGRIGNGGSILVGSGLPVSFYSDDPAGGGVLLGTTNTSGSLVPGRYEDVSLELAPGFDDSIDVCVSADDAGGLVSTENECDEDNNIHCATPVFESFDDVTPDVELTYLNTTYNRFTLQLIFELEITNIGSTPLNTPLRLVLSDITDPGVIPANADGTMPGGDPYFLFEAVGGGAIDPGETSAIRLMIFDNVDGLHLFYDTTVLAPTSGKARIQRGTQVTPPAIGQ
jgi:hypothetical protein